MTHQELELWTQEIVPAVLKNQRIEDSKIELKSSWPEPSKAAHVLAAHANAARGAAILWLIGVDEKGQRLTNPNPAELANWSASVERFFDGDAPRMVLDATTNRGRSRGIISHQVDLPPTPAPYKPRHSSSRTQLSPSRECLSKDRQ